jgi:hypothetical protein
MTVRSAKAQPKSLTAARSGLPRPALKMGFVPAIP